MSGNIIHPICDRLLQFVLNEDFIALPSPRNSNVYRGNFNNFDNNKLKDDLNKIDWNNDIYKDREAEFI